MNDGNTAARDSDSASECHTNDRKEERIAMDNPTAMRIKSDVPVLRKYAGREVTTIVSTLKRDGESAPYAYIVLLRGVRGTLYVRAEEVEAAR